MIGTFVCSLISRLMFNKEQLEHEHRGLSGSSQLACLQLPAIRRRSDPPEGREKEAER